MASNIPGAMAFLAAVPRYIPFLEQNTHIIYPVLAAGGLLIIALGILQAWRTQDLDGIQKAELKRDIMMELRRTGGMSAELIARAIGLETFKTTRLLEEMKQDGIIMMYTNTERLSVWSLKGTPPTQPGGRSR